MTQQAMDKVYDPKKAETKWYRFWEQYRLFHADPNSSKKPHVIMIPPPNVTGMLTLGHVINNTIQDILIRWKRMEGFECLWLPGTDHAGIATQNKVEEMLTKEGLTRYDLGRERFLARVWEWKEKYGGIILEQLRRLGASCDWERERFTMDEGLSAAVREVFVRLYEKGLVYRDRALINWCPRCKTALSDEESPGKEVPGKLWSIAYPLADSDGEIVVATTRPETMLGDTAVAVHPADERYRHLVGRYAILPLLGRRIPIIADEHADPEKGSGAVKITPAHDFDDFQVGLRHHLPQVVVIDEDGKMTEEAGPYKGLDRTEARARVLSDLEKQGLLRGVEEQITPIPHCYRCDTVVEPALSTQWFVRMKPLAEPAIRVVREGKIRFHPAQHAETYFHWMENVRDWCISRQIWWGHRIPVWYCEHQHVVVSRSEPSSCPECGSRNLRQDEDVLDTWFSSWLWPFSTLGWPERTRDLEVFFPGDTLVTAPDIIFFWVARMIMASLEFMGDIPFRDVYFHSVVRDPQGRKMSKSLGNSPDPLWLIDGASGTEIAEFARKNPSYGKGVPAYGADALRISMVYLTPVGGSIRFDHTLVEFGQKFANKLWNAARFVLMNVRPEDEPLLLEELRPEELLQVDRWILSRLRAAVEAVRSALDEFRFNDATRVLHKFVWGEYCDWYVEFAKEHLDPSAESRRRQVTLSVALAVLERILRLAHPFMPFITEEIWQALPAKCRRAQGVPSIMVQAYPRPEEMPSDGKAEEEIALVQEVISAVRNIRGEMCVPPQAQVKLIVHGAEPHQRALLQQSLHYLDRLARVAELSFDSVRPCAAAGAVVANMSLFVPLEGVIDLELERARLSKEIERVEGQLQTLNARLSNRDFLARAGQEVVGRERQKKSDFEARLSRLQECLRSLG
ncbi:MAG: valine--tRNA ligase [bacterium]|jgi:valyl-tRNA synthetase|nr:valine--tRNA ligase [candidate division KSB1 bacterium]MDH7558782.1 valine--tRNA ligase [bacterium]